MDVTVSNLLYDKSEPGGFLVINIGTLRVVREEKSRTVALKLVISVKGVRAAREAVSSLTN